MYLLARRFRHAREVAAEMVAHVGAGAVQRYDIDQLCQQHCLPLRLLLVPSLQTPSTLYNQFRRFLAQSPFPRDQAEQREREGGGRGRTSKRNHKRWPFP